MNYDSGMLSLSYMSKTAYRDFCSSSKNISSIQENDTLELEKYVDC